MVNMTCSQLRRCQPRSRSVEEGAGVRVSVDLQSIPPGSFQTGPLQGDSDPVAELPVMAGFAGYVQTPLGSGRSPRTRRVLAAHPAIPMPTKIKRRPAQSGRAPSTLRAPTTARAKLSSHVLMYQRRLEANTSTSPAITRPCPGTGWGSRPLTLASESSAATTMEAIASPHPVSYSQEHARTQLGHQARRNERFGEARTDRNDYVEKYGAAKGQHDDIRRGSRPRPIASYDVPAPGAVRGANR